LRLHFGSTEGESTEGGSTEGGSHARWARGGTGASIARIWARTYFPPNPKHFFRKSQFLVFGTDFLCRSADALRGRRTPVRVADQKSGGIIRNAAALPRLFLPARSLSGQHVPWNHRCRRRIGRTFPPHRFEHRNFSRDQPEVAGRTSLVFNKRTTS
jgi:hypothetical protein